MPSDLPERHKANSPQLMTEEQVEEIREAVKAVIVQENLKATEIATASGVKYGTLSLWLTGKYAGRNDRVAYDLKRWLDTREVRKQVETVAPKAPAFVMTKTADEIIGLLQQAQHMPDMAICVGAPGVGKTSAACHYTRTSSNVWKITGDPTTSSPRAVLHKLCRVLGLYATGMQTKLFEVICDRVRGTGGLIIVDEAQNLTPEAHDLVRSIHDNAEIGVALIGNDLIHTRLEGDGKREQFAQLTSRIGVRMKRPRALTKDVEALLNAWSVEGDAERALLRAIARKPGALRLMSKTLKLAHMRAAAEHGSVTASVIRWAFGNVSTDVLPDGIGEVA